MERTGRKLAAVMVTDIVGYTTMAQRDEALALELLEEHRNLLRTRFARHGGREIKTMGDGFLVDFTSALSATECTIDIQQSMRARNAEAPEERRVLLRIGIHVGDVIDQEGDLLGDGMNVASRIEPLAQPGGVCVTAQVYELVRNRIRLPFSSLGRRQLKHIGVPVALYRLVFPWEEVPAAPAPAEPTRIAVLPLVNISPSAEDAYFSDGMTGELIYTLSRLPALRVIAQTSAMKYRDSRKSVAEIAKELNVGTVIEGSVRKAGSRVRITLQLVDAESEEYLWSEAYDRNLEDVFALQEEIAQQVAQVLQVELLGKERSRVCVPPAADVDAYMLYLQGRHFWNRRSEEGVRRAAELFEQAICLDDRYAPAYAGLADAHAVLVNWGYAPKRDALKEARQAAEKAIALDPSLAEAHASLGLVLLEEADDLARAEESFRRATALNPSYAPAHHWLANVLHTTGRTEEGLQEIRKALQLDPLSPTIAVVAGEFLYEAGREDEAISQWRRALEIAPGFVRARFSLAHAYQAAGDWERANEALTQALTADPEAPTAHAEYGAHLLCLGRVEEARAALRRAAARAHAPFSGHHLGLALVCSGAEDTAREMLARATEQDDDWPGLRLSLAVAGALGGERDRAVESLQALANRYAGSLPRLAEAAHSIRGLVEAITGNAQEARALVARQAKATMRSDTTNTVIGLTRLWLGDLDAGFDRLSEAVRERESMVRMLKVLPLPEGARADPRYTKLLRSLNLPLEEAETRTPAAAPEVRED